VAKRGERWLEFGWRGAVWEMRQPFEAPFEAQGKQASKLPHSTFGQRWFVSVWAEIRLRVGWVLPVPLHDFMLRFLVALFLFSCASANLFGTPPQSAERLKLPDGGEAILEHIYSWQLDRAIAEAKQLQRQVPEHPLGYLLEAEAEWWKTWCTAAEFKYGMSLPRRREKRESDQAHLEVVNKATALADAGLQTRESAEMHLYAGMADAQLARIYGLRGEFRNAARAGVAARAHFQRALELDPALADACAGLGLYDYYVDTLSGIARMLRFVMGIPGGSKAEGIRLLQRAIAEGVLTPPAARFELAINFHKYDQRYEDALAVITPLTERFPQNPVFQLARGDLYAKLARKPQAIAAYQAALAANSGDEECRKKIQQLANESLAAVNGAAAAQTH
jgi:tetratricopeptide (TPR) repeat protein